MKEFLLTLAALSVLCVTVQAAEIKVSSPEGKAVATVTDAGGLSYSALLAGHEVVARSRFGIVADGVDLGADARLGKSTSHTIRESYPIFGRHAEALNNCRESTVSVRTAAGESYELDVRAYNGKLVESTIRSLNGGPAKLRYASVTREVKLAKGETYRWNGK